jgi:hypothetical protein
VRFIIWILATSAAAIAQTAPQVPKSDQNPPVKVNVLNVCTPNGDEQQQLRTALEHLPKAPSFASDYEIARGITTLEEGKSAKYVRLRREANSDSPLDTVQYSLSSDPASTIETLVFRGRNVKDLLALSIEDKLSTSVSKPSTVVESDTPASHLRLERAGKTTVALARCEGVDQSQYGPIFAQASSVLANYRRLLKIRTMLTSDVSWLNSGNAFSTPKSRDAQPHSKPTAPEDPGQPSSAAPKVQ